MTGYDFTLAGASLVALGSGALFWPSQDLLCVADLHLGESGHRARQGNAPVPPHDTSDTLSRFEADLRATKAGTVICLGVSFDTHDTAFALPGREKLRVISLQAGRRWVWITGTHNPGPVDLGGTHLAELPLAPLTFRPMAKPAASGEVSGHFHPKATLTIRNRTVTRPAFLIDGDRVILPAYGIRTGALCNHDKALQTLMRREALAVLTGPVPHSALIPR